MAPPIDKSIQKLCDSATNLDMMDPIICRQKNMKKLSDYDSYLYLLYPTMMKNMNNMSDSTSK